MRYCAVNRGDFQIIVDLSAAIVVSLRPLKIDVAGFHHVFVVPANAGIQLYAEGFRTLDSGLTGLMAVESHRDDSLKRFRFRF